MEKAGLKCELCGYSLYPQILQIHHKDGNCNNHELNNLAVLCPTCHCTLHYKTSKKYFSEEGLKRVVKRKKWGGLSRKEQTRIQSKNYYYKNKDKVSQRQKNYYKLNRENMLKRHAEYRRKNKERILKHARECYWRKRRKAKLNAKGV